ncbi:MAG: hypothetical protein GX153_09905 [Clostridiaceae bacterium]|nr:hypothetical protein [Clostridiaceae bacterium]
MATPSKKAALLEAGLKGFQQLNEEVAAALVEHDAVEIRAVYGQRYIGNGLEEDKRIDIHGTPGNDLGVYLDGGVLHVHGNGQDAVGNTMNRGTIVVEGHAGDALGYAMRGGAMYIRGDVGYRCGIHMKEYKTSRPVIVIGGRAGSYLAEYMAGGIIILLSIDYANAVPGGKPGLLTPGDPLLPQTGPFFATGMHGGTVYVRGPVDPALLSAAVTTAPAERPEDLQLLRTEIRAFGKLFRVDPEPLLASSFTRVNCVSSRPYKNIYANN